VIRRAFVTALAGAAAWPLVGNAEQSGQLRGLGWLVPWAEREPVTQASASVLAHAVEQFGWVEGKNIID
jgi:hypothetical protein